MPRPEAAREALLEDVVVPAGFAYAPDLVTEDEEQALLAELERLDFADGGGLGSIASRTAQHYGEPLPDWLEPARVKAAEVLGVEPDQLVEAVVQRYPPGAGSGWDRDSRADGTTVTICLLGPEGMRFRRNVAGGRQAAEIEVATRSGHVLAEPARTRWQRRIVAAEALRYTITFWHGAVRREQA